MHDELGRRPGHPTAAVFYHTPSFPRSQGQLGRGAESTDCQPAPLAPSTWGTVASRAHSPPLPIMTAAAGASWPGAAPGRRSPGNVCLHRTLRGNRRAAGRAIQVVKREADRLQRRIGAGLDRAQGMIGRYSSLRRHIREHRCLGIHFTAHQLNSATATRGIISCKSPGFRRSASPC